MASICTSNVTSGFIDLATFDEIEKYIIIVIVTYFVVNSQVDLVHSFPLSFRVRRAPQPSTPKGGNDLACILQSWLRLQPHRSPLTPVTNSVPMLVFVGLVTSCTISSVSAALLSMTLLRRALTITTLISGRRSLSQRASATATKT